MKNKNNHLLTKAVFKTVTKNQFFHLIKVIMMPINYKIKFQTCMNLKNIKIIFSQDFI